MAQPFHIGINDIQGHDPAGQPFSPNVFNLFDAWAVYDQDGRPRSRPRPRLCRRAGGRRLSPPPRRRRPRGDLPRPGDLQQPSSSTSAASTASTTSLGQAERDRDLQHLPQRAERRRALGGPDVRRRDRGPDQLRPELPLVTVQNKPTNETRSVCDLGRANGSRLWAEIGTFRAPPLRGLAARPPVLSRRPGADASRTSSTTSTGGSRSASAAARRATWWRSSSAL